MPDFDSFSFVKLQIEANVKLGQEPESEPGRSHSIKFLSLTKEFYEKSVFGLANEVNFNDARTGKEEQAVEHRLAFGDLAGVVK